MEPVKPKPKSRWLARRPKTLEQLADDPALLYHAQYLVGTASTVGYWMAMQDDPQTKAMGEKLMQAASWFYMPEPK
jgi:hypothetical protein